MNKLLILLLFLGCREPKTIIHPIIVTPPYDSTGVPHALAEGSFLIKSETGAYGIGFILEGKIVTASHVVNSYANSPDISILGISDGYKGLSLCVDRHNPGDLLFYFTYSGIHIGNILGGNDINKLNTMDFQSEDLILFGDSGSPVICAAHSKVIGLISGVYGYSKNYQFGGFMSKGGHFGTYQEIKKEDLK